MSEKTGKTMKEFEDDLDETGTSPKKKTPKELQENPMDLIGDEDDLDSKKRQRDLNDTWQAATDGAPQHPSKDQPAPAGPPGSGASEGKGNHTWGIDDNGSGKKSAIKSE